MKKIILTAASLALSWGLSAQELSKEDVLKIQASFVKDAPTTALQNVLTNNANIRELALNHEFQGKTDHYFKYKVDVKGITDQKNSGRCWMFTSMNVLRPSIMKQFGISEFNFSQCYNYFWDIFEKSNLFLENAIRTAGKDMLDEEVSFYFKSPINDGGVWNLFYNVAEKYGVVPQSVMPETAHSNNTGAMSSIIKERLRAGGMQLRDLVNKGSKAKTIKEAKMDIMKDVYRVLALCLGNPPTEFTWRYKTTDGQIKSLESTPLDFYHTIRPKNYDPDTYIMIMNDPIREYYKVYEIDNYRNSQEGVNWVYLNLPNDVIKAAALESLKANVPMYASCDVRKYNDMTSGVSDPSMYDYESLFGIKLDMDKKARVLTRQSGSSHAMNLVAVDTDENGKTIKWQFENSWGPSAGHRGFITFTDEWFDEYMFRIVIDKQYLDSKSAKAASSKPIVLPAWDYMY